MKRKLITVGCSAEAEFHPGHTAAASMGFQKHNELNDDRKQIRRVVGLCYYFGLLLDEA